MIPCPVCAVPNDRHDSVSSEFAVCRRCQSFLSFTDKATAFRVLTSREIEALDLHTRRQLIGARAFGA